MSQFADLQEGSPILHHHSWFLRLQALEPYTSYLNKRTNKAENGGQMNFMKYRESSELALQHTYIHLIVKHNAYSVE